MNVSSPVPTFHLYGEPHRSTADNFLHVERLADRSLPAGWTIRPHAHHELNHVILIADGGGVMQADGGASDFGVEASMLKLRASDLAMRITTEAVQLHGGYGYCKDYRVERLMRDAKITQIWEGTNQIHRQFIGRSFIRKN